MKAKLVQAISLGGVWEGCLQRVAQLRGKAAPCCPYGPFLTTEATIWTSTGQLGDPILVQANPILVQAIPLGGGVGGDLCNVWPNCVVMQHHVTHMDHS